jgi:hypothetical protein
MRNGNTMKNLSAEPTNKLYAWLPHDLGAEEIASYGALVTDDRR